LAALIAFGQAGAAQAQEQATSQQSAASESEQQSGNVIIVTARGRDEQLQDVPDSIIALTADDILDQDIRQINDAINVLPNIAIVDSQDLGLSLINIRGIGQVRNGEPPVAFVVDGVQLTSADIFNQDLFDVQSIEILKGPQGALYGRNAIAGAFVIETQRPGNVFEGNIEARFANGPEVGVSGVLRGPIIEDVVQFSIAGSATMFDGLIDNVTVRQPAPTTEGPGAVGEPVEVDNYDQANLRGRLIITPSDRLTIDARATYSYIEGGASYFISMPPGQPNNTDVPVQNDEIGFSDREHQEYSLKLDYEFDGFTVTSVTAHSKTDFFLHEDLDWTPDPILGLDQARFSRSWSEDLRLTSNDDGPLRWSFGGYYLDVYRTIDTILLVETPADGLLDLPIPIARPTERNEAYALYGQINYDLTPDLELTLAGRYDWDDREQTDRLTNVVTEASFKAFQPKVSLAYNWTDDVMTYVSVGKGFRSGGFNAPGAIFPLIYDAETAWNYETGLKSSWLGGDLLVNAAAFYTQFENMQQFSFVQGLQGLFNVADVDIFGVELEVAAEPVNNLELFASVGILDSEVKDFEGRIESAPGVVLVEAANVVGNQIPRMYGWSYRAGGQYTLPLTRSWEMTARVDYTGQGDNFWHLDNLDAEKDRHLVNASLGFNKDDLTITFYAENLFDHEYTEEFFAQEWLGLVSDIRWPGRPRRYGVRVRHEF
jgi:iron complex outermembrane receptor protein